MKSTLNQLNNAFAKRLKQLNKDISNTSCIVIFVEHLKHLRDTYIINQGPTEVIASLNTAIEEFEAYRKTQKEFHWNNFCEFIKLNMKEWLAANDSV